MLSLKLYHSAIWGPKAALCVCAGHCCCFIFCHLNPGLKFRFRFVTAYKKWNLTFELKEEEKMEKWKHKSVERCMHYPLVVCKGNRKWGKRRHFLCYCSFGPGPLVSANIRLHYLLGVFPWYPLSVGHIAQYMHCMTSGLKRVNLRMQIALRGWCVTVMSFCQKACAGSVNSIREFWK